jgi:hypothetical protein
LRDNQLISIPTAYVFVPSVFRENIPTAEFGMISAETACWDIEKIAKFLMRTFTCCSTFLYESPDKPILLKYVSTLIARK